MPYESDNPSGMATITNDEDLFRYAARARGRVVLITGQGARVHDPGGHQSTLRSHISISIGGAAGPARHAAWSFAKNGFVPPHVR